MIINCKAPVRIDFAGGWTDVDIFAKSVGGAVLNAAIDKYVTGKFEIFDGTTDISGNLQEGIKISYRSELPAGSGLGTSSALNVVWLTMVKSRITGAEDKKTIAGLAYELEAMLGILGGKQDQYASAIGGFNYMTFGNEVKVETLDISPSVVRELEERLVLCYTGKQRLSGNIHENVWGAYRRGAPETVNALYNLRDIASGMKCALLSGNIDVFSDLMNKNWECQKQLDASVTNAQIEELFDEAFKYGAIGGKACGAGGGGCVLFLSAPGRRAEIEQRIEQLGSRIIPFKFDFQGLQLEDMQRPSPGTF